MRRYGMIALSALLFLSLAGNAALGWAAWTAQKEYRALAKLFVKTKQELAAAKDTPTPKPAAAEQPFATPPVILPPVAAPAATPGPSTSVEAVRASYAPRLASVQAECEGQLNAMIEAAKAEYTQAKAAGGTVDVAALGAKYLSRSDGMRRQCDRKVDAIISDLASDLRAAGLPLTLVDEVREAYEARIVERQAEIMAKAPAQ